MATAPADCGVQPAEPGSQHIDLVGSDTYVKAGDHGPLTSMYQKTKAMAGGRRSR